MWMIINNGRRCPGRTTVCLTVVPTNDHVANIQGRGKAVHVVFEYLFISLQLTGVGAGGVTSSFYFPVHLWIFH
jgi:homoserine dehydrogenase